MKRRKLSRIEQIEQPATQHHSDIKKILRQKKMRFQITIRLTLFIVNVLNMRNQFCSINSIPNRNLLVNIYYGSKLFGDKRHYCFAFKSEIIVNFYRMLILI